VFEAVFVALHVGVAKVDSSNGQAGNRRPTMILHILVLSAGSFAVGTGTFVVTGVLTDIAEDLSVSVANAGLLVTASASCHGAPPTSTTDSVRLRLLAPARPTTLQG
jgi:predicted MFS family arabinose efflux permease